MGSNEVGKLNPLVQPSGAVKRLFVSEAARGGTPPVFIQNPETPYFDPYNHEFPQTNANVHSHFGQHFTGGWTALHAAAEAKFAGTHDNKRPVNADLDEAKFLLEGRGHHVPPSITIPHYSSPPVDVNAAMTKTGLTPMHVAVRAEHKDMVELLLERKARVDVQDTIGRTPIHYACEAGFVSCLEPMIAYGGHNKAGFLTVVVEQAHDLPMLCNEEEISFFTTVRVSRSEAAPATATASVTSTRGGGLGGTAGAGAGEAGAARASTHSAAPAEKSSPVKHRTLSPEWNFSAQFQNCNPRTEFTVEVHCRFVDGQETPAGKWSAAVRDFIRDDDMDVMDEKMETASQQSAMSGAAPGDSPQVHSSKSAPKVDSIKPGADVSSAWRRASIDSSKTASSCGKDQLRPKEEAILEAAGRFPLTKFPDMAGSKTAKKEVGSVQVSIKYTRAVDIEDSMGTTALMLAGEGGHMECVSSLLSAKADATIRETLGTTAASRAGTAGHAEVCRLIEEHGGAW